MKLKYFLKGFGSGVLFATVILSIALLLRPEGKADLTDGEIMARARELGMETVSAGREEMSGAPKETDTSIEEKLTETKADAGEESQEMPVESETMSEPIVPVEPETMAVSAPETELASVSVEDERIIIEIARGLYAEEVAQILQKAEVVDSSDEFNYYMMSQGMSRIIRAGTYEFSRGMSFEDIAEVIRLPEE